jgi:tight adherence protein B
MKLTVGGLLLASACLFAAAWLVVAWLTRLQWLGLAIGLVLAFAPLQIVRMRATKRMRKFEEQFPDIVDLIARALRAGHAFTTGLALAAEEAPQPVAGEFRLLYDQQNFGMPLPEALRALADRVPLLDARFFVTAVLTQRESGGNLAEILGNLANVTRERFKVKRQVRVLSAHGRITGWVLSGIPPALGAGMMVVVPGHVQVLVDDPMGPPMVLAGLFLQVVGMLIIRKLVDIEY